MDKCKCDNHDQHLCQLTNKGLHQNDPDQYAHLVRNPEFVCTSCGRVAAEKKSLCAPVRLGTFEE